MTLDDHELLARLRQSRYAVVATLGPNGAPQAATVGFAATDERELVFDTLTSTRKWHNIQRDARVAVVVTEGETTFQLEGVADTPSGAAHERLLAAYLAVFPDGAERLQAPGIMHVRVTIRWLRYTDYREAEPVIVERTFA